MVHFPSVQILTGIDILAKAPCALSYWLYASASTSAIGSPSDLLMSVITPVGKCQATIRQMQTELKEAKGGLMRELALS